MVILGLYLGHDANWCILRDGVVLCHVEAERTSRKKHQKGMHRASLEGALRKANVMLSDIDLVAVGGTFVGPSSDSWPEIEDVIVPIIKDAVIPVHNFAAVKQSGAVAGWTASSAKLGGKTVPVIVVHHHLSHASLGYYTSPYKDCLSVSWDGGGDGAYLAYIRGQGGKITECVYNPPAGKLGLSIGAPWSVLPLLYPFPEVERSNAADKYLLDLEGKVMGHAAYGTPRENWKALIRKYAVEFNGHAALLDRARSGLGNLVDFTTHKSKSLMDLSASLQSVTEDMMLEVLGKIAKPGEPITLSGGCAYNCVANGRIFQDYPKVYVPACPHDGGLSMGAALFAWHHLLGNSFEGIPEQTPYLGTGEFRADPKVAPQVAEDLVNGKIVAWFDGPAESGKRALGARSILLDPRRKDGKDYLNDTVKHREWFRPYAPSVLVRPGDDTSWCDGETPRSPYMSFSAYFKERYQSAVPSVSHVDGTCRPQTVTGKNNPTYAAIIQAFYELTDIPMILNTSFNTQEPIVDTPEHAMRTFKEAPIDVLYVHGERFSK